MAVSSLVGKNTSQNGKDRYFRWCTQITAYKILKA